MSHVYDEYGNSNEMKNLPTKRSTSAPNLGPKGIHILMNEEYYRNNYGCSDVESEHKKFLLKPLFFDFILTQSKTNNICFQIQSFNFFFALNQITLFLY